MLDTALQDCISYVVASHIPLQMRTNSQIPILIQTTPLLPLFTRMHPSPSVSVEATSLLVSTDRMVICRQRQPL